MKKKVEDCTIKELKKWFDKNYKDKLKHIVVGWNEVVFYTIENEVANTTRNHYNYLCTRILKKDEEIEVD